MQDNKNFFLAIALSMIVLIGWNVFFGLPTAEKARKEAQMQTQVAGDRTAVRPAGLRPQARPRPRPPTSRSPAPPPRPATPRSPASPRIAIDTPQPRAARSR